MPEPLSTVASGIAASLAADAVDWGIRHSMSTRAGRKIQEKVGFGEIHPKAKEVFERAIIRAGDEILQLDGSALNKFIEDEQNREVIASWVWNPDRAEITRDQLNWNVAGSQNDHSNIKHLLNLLPEALRELRSEVFSDDAWFVVQEVVKATKHEGKRTRETVEEEGKKTRSEFRSEMQDLKSLITRQEVASEDTSQLEEAVREEIEQIRELREEDRINDALILADQSLESAEYRGLRDKVIRAIHNEIANCHLSRVDHREDAISHLQRVAELADDESKALLNRAVIDLLEGNIEDGLERIDRVLDEQPDEKDAVLLKAQLLADAGKASEAVDLFEEIADLEDPDDLYNLGTLEVRSSQFPSARTRADRALEVDKSDPSAHFLYGLSVVVQRHEEIDHGEIELSEDMGDLLESGRHHLERAIQEYNEDQQRDRAAMAHFNLGVLLSMRGNENEAHTQFIEANKLSPKNPKTLYNLAHTSLNVGDGSEGLRFVRELENTNHDFSDEEIIHLKSNLLMEAGGPDEAIDLLEETSEREEVDDIPVRLLRTRALHRSLETEEAGKALDQVISDHPEDPRPYLERGILRREDGDLEKAIEDFRAALDRSGSELEGRVQRLLADALFLWGGREREKNLDRPAAEADNEWKNHLEEAEELYQRISSPTLNTLELRRRALCLFRLGRYPECIQLCERAQGDERVPALTELEGLVFQLHESFSKAADRFKWLIQNHQKSPQLLLKYSTCLFRLGKLNQAKDAVDQAARQIPEDSVEEQLTISQTYAEYGELKSAVQHAYLALQAEEDDPRAHQYYISLFLRRGDDIREQDAASKEHREKFHEALVGYEDKFSDRPFFESGEVPTDDSEALADEIKGVLPAFEDQKKQARAIREDEIPVGSAAKMLGRRIPETWKFLSSHPDYYVKANEGKEGLIGEEAEVAHSSAGIVVDLVPLLTLQELGLLEELSEEFSRILVPQAALDELRETISNERPREGKPRRSIKQTEEGIASVEKPAEAGDRWLYQLERLYEFLTSDSVTPIGQTVHRDSTPKALADVGDTEDEDLAYEDLLGNVSAEAILEGRARGLPVYSEDRIIRHLIRSEGRQAFGTRALLEILLQKEQIEAQTYHEARVRLLRMNYVFPLTSAQTIAFAIEREDFVTTAFSKAPINALKFPGTSLESIARIVVGVLVWLWTTHPVGVEVKPALSAYWMGKVLSAATKGPGRRVLGPTLAKIVNEYILPELSPLAASQFAESFENWQRRQGHRLFPGEVASSLNFPKPIPFSYHTPDSEADTFVDSPNTA